MGRLSGGTMLNLTLFREYQKWLADDLLRCPIYSGLLAQYDIIVTPAFDCSYNVDMGKTFVGRGLLRIGRFSRRKSYMLGEFSHTAIYSPMHFVTRAAVFNRFMEWWWPRLPKTFAAALSRKMFMTRPTCSPYGISYQSACFLSGLIIRIEFRRGPFIAMLGCEMKPIILIAAWQGYKARGDQDACRETYLKEWGHLIPHQFVYDREYKD